MKTLDRSRHISGRLIFRFKRIQAVSSRSNHVHREKKMKDGEKFIAEIEDKARKWDISAALSICDREGFRYEKAFGYADRGTQRPLTVDDRFCLDAENGFFLTLCVLHLAEGKKLRLSDRVSRFIPEYRHGDRITVRNLLRYNAGIEDYWSAIRLREIQKDPAHAALDERERFRREFVLRAEGASFQEVLRAVNDRDLKHEPGRDSEGGETGYMFLSEIVRRVSGMTPPEYLCRYFFAPLGMDETRPGNDATTALYGIMRDTELIPLPRVCPAGVFTTTLRDMSTLARALAEKRFFSQRTWEIMLKCDADMVGLGCVKRGELYLADLYPWRMRDTCLLGLNFADGVSILLLNNEETKTKMDENRRWRSFSSDLRRAWQDTRVYPQNPELKRVNGKNIGDALDIELLPEQLAFVPECARCIAATLARKQPAYILMDHGVAIGLAALTVKPKKKEYSVTFLQVDHRYQGRGYGRILLTRAIEILKEKGAETLEIGVNRFNIPAQRLYRGVGFQDKEVYDGFIEMKMTL